MLWSIVNASDGHLIDITNRQMPYRPLIGISAHPAA
jgi:hypothetical protein